MRYQLLGRTGLRVSELALGTMTFGEAWGWGSNKDTSHAILEAYLEAGGNYIDTADFYVDGTSETYLGEFLTNRREQVVLGTKFNSASPGSTRDPNATGNSRKHMVHALEASLRRLRTDYIDIYTVHVPDFMTPVEELMRALDDLVRAGKVLYTGVSDFPAWQIAQANTLAEARGWTPFTVTTLNYNLAERTAERELLPMAHALDVGVTSWSPLAMGLLTGKYTAESPPDAAGRRLDDYPLLPLSERNLAIAAQVVTEAHQAGVAPAQLALAWVRTQGVIPVLGARTLNQLHQNLGALDVTLEPDQLQRLDDATRVPLGFPIEFLADPEIHAGIYAGMFNQIDTHRPQMMPPAIRAHALPNGLN